jgi:hypothetical protein
MKEVTMWRKEVKEGSEGGKEVVEGSENRERSKGRK